MTLFDNRKRKPLLRKGAFRYPAALQPLLVLGKPEDDTDYTALADGLEDSVPALIAMVLDDDLNHREEEDPAVWAPLHALRVLKVLRAESAVEPLLETLEWEDEWFAEELPEFFGAVGGGCHDAVEGRAV